MPSSRQRAASPAWPRGRQHHDRWRRPAPASLPDPLRQREAVHLGHHARRGARAGTGRPRRAASRSAASAAVAAVDAAWARIPSRAASRRGCGGWSRCRPRPARGSPRRRPSSCAAARGGLGAARRSGTVKWKVLPLPGSLSTQIRPPISATSCDGDRQPQAGAAVLPRGRAVGLGEASKIASLLVRRDADAGVAHGEVQVAPPSRSPLALDLDAPPRPAR